MRATLPVKATGEPAVDYQHRASERQANLPLRSRDETVLRESAEFNRALS
jgi:hypothetical protein